MHLVVAISIAVLLLATAGSLVVLVRSGDPRAALLTAGFALLAATEGAVLWSLDPRPLGLDVPSVAAGLALAASALCPFMVLAVARTLRERDRSESLHWSSMETVRAMADLAALSSLDLDGRLLRLVEIGCEHFGLEVGLVARIAGGRYEVRAIRAPRELPIERGAVFPLDSTWCRLALESARPVDVARIPASAFASHRARVAFPFECYLGTAVRVGGETWGSLAFGSLSARRERFTATEKDLLTLMARWLGADLERRRAGRERSAAASPDPAPPSGLSPLSPGWERRPVGGARRSRREPRPLDLNLSIARLERRLARAAGARAQLRLALAPDLAASRDPRIPLEAILLSLVGHAAEAVRSGGRIEVATAELEVSSQPDRLPAVAPDRYLTVSVRVAADEVDPDALSCAFDAPAGEVSVTGDAHRLSLPVLYRLLQHRGGDLSVEVEPGRGIGFTVFLPRPGGAEAGRAATSAPAPTPTAG